MNSVTITAIIFAVIFLAYIVFFLIPKNTKQDAGIPNSFFPWSSISREPPIASDIRYRKESAKKMRLLLTQIRKEYRQVSKDKERKQNNREPFHPTN